ncbi:MAG: hypothetical protein HYY04_15635 [Chloroflexi bacterium]|nr:hypothetical protein [Chloroflexota bacterium]
MRQPDTLYAFPGARLGVRALALIVSCLLVITSLPIALAANDSPETAAELTAERPSGGGSLTGNRAGAFQYFWFSYPGGERPVVVTLNVNRSYGSVGTAIGFNLYGTAGHLGSGMPLDGNRDSTTARLPFTQQVAGRILVQVFNYTDGGPLEFGLEVAGLAPSAAADTRGSEQPSTAPTVRAAAPLIAGSLTGSSAGAFRFFQLDYSGGDVPLAVTISFTPRYALSDAALGANLYRDGTLVATSAEVQRTDTTVVHYLTYRGRSADVLGLQIYNYAPNYLVAFSASVTGILATSREAAGNEDPGRALPLTSATSSYTGTIAGRRAGNFAFFTLEHPGGSRTTSLVLSLPRLSNLATDSIGFNVYRGSELVGHVPATPDDQGRLIAIATLAPEQATSYGIQVYNYNEGTSPPYRLALNGL